MTANGQIRQNNNNTYNNYNKNNNNKNIKKRKKKGTKTPQKTKTEQYCLGETTIKRELLLLIKRSL